MDTSERISVETPQQITRRRRSVEEKRRIVEETLEAGVSVARVARRHAVNANQVFYWRKKYREGRLGKNQSSKLLPVTLSDISWSKSGRAGCASSPSAVGSMKINSDAQHVFATVTDSLTVLVGLEPPIPLWCLILQ
jgi:transposase